MELYLKWLDRYERQPGEEQPIGIILCASANREIMEMLEMDRAGVLLLLNIGRTFRLKLYLKEKSVRYF